MPDLFLVSFRSPAPAALLEPESDFLLFSVTKRNFWSVQSSSRRLRLDLRSICADLILYPVSLAFCCCMYVLRFLGSSLVSIFCLLALCMRQNPESIATAPCHLPFDLIEICFSSSFKLVFKVVSSSTSPYPVWRLWK